MEKRTIEMTTTDGRKYQFVQSFCDMVSTYAWYDNKFNHISKTFKSMDEAAAWIEELNKPQVWEPVKMEIPADYYGVRGRYYGD